MNRRVSLRHAEIVTASACISDSSTPSARATTMRRLQFGEPYGWGNVLSGIIGIWGRYGAAGSHRAGCSRGVLLRWHSTSISPIHR
jgi:hypothetical protein